MVDHKHKFHCLQFTKFYITMDWEGADQKISSCSKMDIFKLFFNTTNQLLDVWNMDRIDPRFNSVHSEEVLR